MTYRVISKRTETVADYFPSCEQHHSSQTVLKLVTIALTPQGQLGRLLSLHRPPRHLRRHLHRHCHLDQILHQ